MKKLLIGSTILLSLAGATSYALTSPTNIGAESDLPIRVQRHDEQLANHEARITNTENDVTDLQSNTNTPPSPTRVEVPVVITPQPPAPTPEPTPVTVVAFEQIPVGDSQIDCRITYSDNTNHTFVWQQWEYNQGSKITRTTGKCDTSIIGKVKSTQSPVGYV